MHKIGIFLKIFEKQSWAGRVAGRYMITRAAGIWYQATGIRQQVSGNRYQATGIRQQVSGNRYQATAGNRYQATGIRQQVNR